jgi:DNA-binding response OmpR family regulator
LVARVSLVARHVIKFGDLVFDLDEKMVEVNGGCVPLMDGEYQLLGMLARKKEPHTKQAIAHEIIGTQSPTAMKVVDTYAGMLRLNLARAGSKITIKQTKTGEYFLSDEADETKHSSVA